MITTTVGMRFNLEGIVVFSPSESRLIGANGSVVELTENSRRLLLLLLNGVTDKENIISEVWQERRGAVSENSYYGQLYMLRNAFSQAGLKKSLLRTIPRKGVQYMGSVLPVWEDNSSVPGSVNGVTGQRDNGRAATVLSSWLSQVLSGRRGQITLSLLVLLNFCWLALLSVLLVT